MVGYAKITQMKKQDIPMILRLVSLSQTLKIFKAPFGVARANGLSDLNENTKCFLCGDEPATNIRDKYYNDYCENCMEVIK